MNLEVAGRSIGPGASTFVIAEAGVNHNGSPGLALELVAAAARSGADAVKFQMFRAEDVVTSAAPKARYQLETTDPRESQLAMLKALELPWDTYPALMREAEAQDVIFLCSCYAPRELDYLDELGMPAFKFASALIIELPLLRHAAEKGKPVLLSTGMATLGEVRDAVKVVRDAGAPVALFQCTTDYPADPAEANLLTIPALAKEFDAPVGYSDHTVGDATALASIAVGATMIEKHFTLDKTMDGPDHSASLEPGEFAEMTRRIRTVEQALGDGRKEPTARELVNASGMRRALVAAAPIQAGTVITPELVATKRPAVGLAPKDVDVILGTRARVDIAADTPFSLDLLETA